MTKSKRRRVDPFNVLLEILIDLILIGMGVALYLVLFYHYIPGVGLHPAFIKLVGSEKVAILLVSGIPVLIGVLSFLRTLYRVVVRPTVPKSR